VNDKQKLAAGGAVAAVMLIGAVLVMRRKPAPASPPPAASAPPPPSSAPSKPAEAPAPAPVAAIPLPELGQSDPFIRDRAKALSADARLAAWLKGDNLVRRLAAATDMISAGKVPTDSLGALAPRRAFTAVSKGGRTIVSPKSYARYDAVATAVASVDAKAAATLFTQTKPLFQQACKELGDKSCDFQDTFVRAASEVLETPLVDGDVEVKVKPNGFTYTFADPQLESLDAVQKQVLRMGPANARKVEAKLREIGAALGVSADQLSASPAPRASALGPAPSKDDAADDAPAKVVAPTKAAVPAGGGPVDSLDAQ
jgi:hypothetical protein